MIGEHIRALKGGRWVHAIDCGDETVLHLAEEPTPRRVRRAYRPEFLSGAASVEAVTHRERTFPAKEVVRRAYSRASDPALAAMFGDSEAFAEWCTTGRVVGPLALPVATPAPADAAPGVEAPPRDAGRPARASAVVRKPGKANASKRAAPKRGATRRAAPRRKSARRKGGRR